MKAKKFRIGNWIIDYEVEPEETIYYQVEEIQILSNDKALNQTLGVTYRNGSCWAFDIEPVPLTEEWLLKCGYVFTNIYQGFNQYRNGSVLELSITPNGFELFFNYKWIKIKYVHQLQNLYFLLTENELEYER
jgi:hypothetical protein